MARSNSVSEPSTGEPIVDPAAGRLLSLAIQAEKDQRYLMAKELYTEGIQILFDSVRNIVDKDLRSSLMVKVRQYMERAEAIKRLIETEKSRPQGYHEQVQIAEGSTGHGLEKLFSDYLDGDITEIQIDDPYIRAPHQIQMFVRFCAVVVKHARNLKSLRLKTSPDPNREMQLNRLQEISTSLAKRSVHLHVDFSESLHDREIRLNNGWIIKIGRGLDYFRKPDGNNSLDYYDLDFRPCLATTVDYIFKPSLCLTNGNLRK